MALNLVHQISSNINYSVLNASAKGIRRFHSLSPATRKPSDQSNGVQQQQHQQLPKSTQRRCLSCSSFQNLFRRDGGSILNTHGQSISRDQHYEDEYEVQPPVLYKKHSRDVQNTSMEYDEEDEDYITDSSFSKSERKNVDTSRQHINPYRLQDSQPRKKRNFYDVYNTYMKDYVQKDYKIVPHLQPSRLQPYGAVHKLTSSSRSPKMFSITYPAKQPDYTARVTRTYSGSRSGSKKPDQPTKQKRDYSTNSDHDLCNKHKNTVVERPKTVPVNNSSVASHSGGFFRKTIKILSDFKGSSNKKEADSIKNCNKIMNADFKGYSNKKKADLVENCNKIINADIKGSSNKKEADPIENCNKIINEYKKLNPNYTSVKKEVKSGSLEEKEAITRALNFVAIYKSRYNNKLFDKSASQDQILNHKSRSTSKVQLRAHHEGYVNRPSQSNLSPNEETNFEAETSNLAEECLAKPTVEFHNSIASIKVRTGTKLDLLQSTAMPEMIKHRQRPLDKNEKLVSPWPSYAETRKRTIENEKYIKKFHEIIYPPRTDNQEPKSAADQVIILPSPQRPQPVLTSSTRSLHRINSDRFSEGTDKQPSSSVNRVHHHSTKSNGVQNSNIKKGKSTTQVCSYIPKGIYVSGQNKVALKNLQLVNFKRYKSSSSKGKKKKDHILNAFTHICDECPKCTPEFESFDCPGVPRKCPVDVPPLKRLKKRPIVPPRVCPKPPECPPRADANYKIKRKKLRCIVPGDCNPPEQVLKEGCPLPRLKKKEIRQPRVCPCVDPECFCPPRADEGLQVEKKCLRKLQPSKCPKVPPKCPIDVPPLKRLKKVKMPQPRVCKKEDPCPPRADDGMVVCPKQLPKYVPKCCPPVEKKPLEDVRLKRLPKFKPKDPPCPPIPDECEEIIRADDECEYIVRPKQLSTMILKEHNNCISITQFNKQKHSKHNRSKKGFSTWTNTNRQDQSVYGIIKNPWGFVCSIWNGGLDCNWISAFLRLVRGKTSLIPVESKTLDNRSDKCSFVSNTQGKCTENNSAPNPINNKTKKKGLSHKIHHPVRSSFYRSVCENLINKNRHMYTSAIRSNKKNQKYQYKVSQYKECKKIVFPKYPQTATNRVMYKYEYKFKKFQKIQTPEWDQITKSKTCDQESLQPKRSITAESEILKPPPTKIGTVDIDKEDCILSKLKKALEGETTECKSLCFPKQPFNGKEVLKEVERSVNNGEARQLQQPLCEPVCEPKLSEYNPKPDVCKPMLHVPHNITQYAPEEEIHLTNITECQSPKERGSKYKFVSESSTREPKPPICEPKLPEYNPKPDVCEPKLHVPNKISQYGSEEEIRLANITEHQSPNERGSKCKSVSASSTREPKPPVCEPKLPEYNPKPDVCEPKLYVPHKITQYGSEEEIRLTDVTESQSPKERGSKFKSVSAASTCELKPSVCEPKLPGYNPEPDVCEPKLHGSEEEIRLANITECQSPKKRGSKFKSVSASSTCEPKPPVCELKLPEYNPEPDVCEPKLHVPHKINQYGSEETVSKCNPVSASTKKQIGFFAKMCNYFKARLNPPKPENWKRKKLEDDVKYAQISPSNCPPCKPTKYKPCKPKKEKPCKPKKEAPPKSKKEKHSCKEPCSPKKVLCKKFTCDPLSREICTYACNSFQFSPVPPNPSSLKYQPGFRAMKTSKKRSQTVHKLRKNMCRKYKIKNSKKGRRNYSTLSCNARKIEFYMAKKFSSYSNGDSKCPTLLQNKKRENLNKRLLEGIEDGIRKLQTQQDLRVSNNSYYKHFNVLETLSENEINELFEEEPLFNPFEPLKEDVRDIVSFVCKFDSRDQQTHNHNDISFERRCIGISDVNAQLFRKNLCNKITQVSAAAQLDYEEQERIKTEKMKKELNKLLEKDKQRTK